MNSTQTTRSAKEQHFVDEMERVRGIEFARIGMQVQMNGEVGTIAGTKNGNLSVTFADQAKHGAKPRNVHPTWRMKYFNAEGEVIAEFGDSGCVFRPERAPA